MEIDVPDSYYNKTKLRSADKAKLRKALAIPGVKVSLSSRYLQVTVPKRDKIADARWANAQEEYKRKLYAYDHEEENYKARMLQYERDLEAWNNQETAKRFIMLRAELKELGGIYDE